MILVVDTQPSGAALVRLLEANGYDCAEASSTSVALHKLREKRNMYDVIVLEPHLKDSNVPSEYTDAPGLYFLSCYRAVAPLARVIIWTERPSLETAVSALSGGAAAPAVAYLEKEQYPVLEKPAGSADILAVVADTMTNIRVDELRIDLREMQAYCTDETGNERPFELTCRHFAIFKIFMLNPDTWFTYQDIARILDNKSLTRSQAHIKYKSNVWRLRKQLKDVTGREVITYHKPRQGFALLRQTE